MSEEPTYVFEERGESGSGPAPKLPPPRWRARRPRGCLGNLALVGLGLFALIAAWCCISGGLIDSVVRPLVEDEQQRVEREGEPIFTPRVTPQDLGIPVGGGRPVARGLRQDAPPAGEPPVPAEEQGPTHTFRPGAAPSTQEKRGGTGEGELFGVE